MNTHVIALEIRSVDALLDADGSPLLEPRIHPEVARAIWHRAEHCLRGTPLEIEFCVPAADAGRGEAVTDAVRRHFLGEREEAEDELTELAHKGRWSFLIALLVVGVFIGLSEAVLRLGEGRLVSILSESLIIVAWVTLWGPAETLLFARFPAQRRRKLAGSLAAARVRLRPR